MSQRNATDADDPEIVAETAEPISSSLQSAVDVQQSPVGSAQSAFCPPDTNRQQCMTTILQNMTRVHIISTPYGGKGSLAENQAGAAEAVRTKQKYEDLMIMVAVFDPNQGLKKRAGHTYWTDKEQGKWWFEQWTEVMRITKEKWTQEAKSLSCATSIFALWATHSVERSMLPS